MDFASSYLAPTPTYPSADQLDISFLNSLSVSSWKLQVRLFWVKTMCHQSYFFHYPQTLPFVSTRSAHHTYVVLPDFLPSEKPDIEQFLDALSELSPKSHAPFERLFNFPCYPFGVLGICKFSCFECSLFSFFTFPLGHILVRLSNLPNTHCLLQWKDGILLRRVNVLPQHNSFNSISDDSLGSFSKEPDYVICDIIILEYLERMAKLKLTVVCLYILLYIQSNAWLV